MLQSLYRMTNEARFLPVGIAYFIDRAQTMRDRSRHDPRSRNESGLQVNRDIADVLDRIARLLSIRGDSPFRVRAYNQAASHLRDLGESVADVSRAGKLQSIVGVGPSIAAKIDAYLQSGRSDYLDQLQRSLPPGVEHLLDVPGIGPARARVLVTQAGVRTPEELAEAAAAHRLRDLPRFGEVLERRIGLEARRWAQRENRLLLGVALPVAETIVEHLRTLATVDDVSIAGSLRRMRETIGDIDLLASAKHTEAVTQAFVKLPMVKEVLGVGPTKASVLLENGLQVDLRVVEPESWGAALQGFTGSKLHNIALREIAIAKGLRINEYGIFETASGRRIGGASETHVYHALGLDWIPPELREARGEILAAAEHRLPTLVDRADLQGDLHVHTLSTDGKATMYHMAVAAQQSGLKYIAITDHTPSLTIAHGQSVENLSRQVRDIADLNTRLAPFRIFSGAEVDILQDGTLDLPESVLNALDYVSVSIHSYFRMEREAMTDRIIRAIGHPTVMTLNHPTGRLIDRRPGYDVDVERVLRAAAELGVALEIDAQPDRLDLNDIWSRRARELGCKLIVNSDAHSIVGLNNIRYGVAVARRAWLTKNDVINTLPVSDFVTWLRRRRRQATLQR